MFMIVVTFFKSGLPLALEQVIVFENLVAFNLNHHCILYTHTDCCRLTFLYVRSC